MAARWRFVLIPSLALIGCDGPSATPKDAKPADTAPATPTPAEPKPADRTPADKPVEKAKPEESIPKDLKVKLSGKPYVLELALTDEVRFRGLSDRSDIASGTGMLFVFPDSKVTVQRFVMRDCPNPIDIIYLDRAQRVTAMYTMSPEPPRSEAEKVNTVFPGGPEWQKTNEAYERRLKPYPSRYPSQYVIELKGGSLKDLTLKEGDKVELPADDLKKWAK